jgi:antitoxin MazE
MSAKIQKWGNSLGIRIPKTIIDKTNLSEDSEVEIETKDGAIIISSLLSKITKKNIHSAEEDEVEGNEVW